MRKGEVLAGHPDPDMDSQGRAVSAFRSSFSRQHGRNLFRNSRSPDNRGEFKRTMLPEVKTQFVSIGNMGCRQWGVEGRDGKTGVHPKNETGN